MSIKLTRLCFEQTALTPTQKHILTVLCFIANDLNEVYLTIQQLAENTNLSIKTIERNLKYLRDVRILLYTGRFEGDFNKIPVYRIVLDNGLSVRGQESITDSASLEDGLCVPSITHTESIPIDNINKTIKDNRKSSFLKNEKAKQYKNSEGPKLLKDLLSKLI